MILDHLEKLRQTGEDKWESLCPVHGSEKNRTLKILRKRDNSWVMHCLSCHCKGVDVFRHLGQDLKEMFGDKEYSQPIISNKNKERYVEDQYFIEIYKADEKSGKRITYQDKRRYKLALARTKNLQEMGIKT